MTTTTIREVTITLNLLRQRSCLALISLALLATACMGPKSEGKAAKPGAIIPVAAATATPVPLSPAQAMRSTVEKRLLPAMSPGLATLIKQQPWYGDLTPARMEIISQAQKCEKAAQPRGEVGSVASMLQFASEQGWYKDGLDEREATALAGIFEAYETSLEDNSAPAIGPLLSTTLKQGLFDVVQLPESGPVVLLVSADKPELGKKALELSESGLPQIEKVVGRYPYHFLHIQVTSDLPAVILGASYNQFIFVRSDSVNPETIDHEMTHSTLFGDFPLWFEEGFAHFLQYYLTNGLDKGLVTYRTELARAAVDPRLDIGAGRGDTQRQELIDRARGFLFVKAVYDIRGIDGLSKMVRTLRTHTYTDQDLMRAIATDGTQDEQDRVAALVCKTVLGTVRNYCVPGR